MAGEQFIQYAKYYDALYADKDYASESRYVNDLLRGYLGDRSLSILEFGSGSGRHAVELCELGNTVVGVEPSVEMISIARVHAAFKLLQGDIRSVGVLGKFDACIAMFHVVSYLHNLEELQHAFSTVVNNLGKGGVFIFDVWHAPAVIKIGPEERSKKAKGQGFSIVRQATPTLHPEKNQVEVQYSAKILHDTGYLDEFQEKHTLTYFWPNQIIESAKNYGLELLFSAESFSGEPPTDNTWSVAYFLRKQ